MDGLPLIQNLTGWGAFVLVCFMVLTDRLVSRKRYEEARVDRDKALDANAKLAAAVNALTRQNDELLEGMRTTNTLLSKLTHAREGPMP